MGVSPFKVKFKVEKGIVTVVEAPETIMKDAFNNEREYEDISMLPIHFDTKVTERLSVLKEDGEYEFEFLPWYDSEPVPYGVDPDTYKTETYCILDLR